MAVWDAIIVASSDDARQAAGAVTLTDSPILLTAGTAWAGLRFTNCPIPNGSTISAATLTVSFTTSGSPDGLIIWGEDVDDAATFTTAASSISSRTPTTANVAWTGTLLGTGDKVSPDISTVIAEITSRVGYAAGNDLALLLDAVPTTDFRFTSYDGSTTACARLSVTYGSAAAAMPKVARVRLSTKVGGLLCSI